MTVVKAGYERPPPSASPNGISTAFMGGNFVRRSDNGRLLDAKAIGQDNPLKLVVALERLIQDCPNRKLGTLTVAMLDGEQLPLTSTTPYLRDDLAFKDRREFEVDVRDLPHDGEAHQLVFLQYDAEREFAEDGNGKLTPWGVLMGATPIGGARWQD
jgi:hypothetical protein